MAKVKTKWLIWLLLDAQIFAQELKELSIKNTADFLFPCCASVLFHSHLQDGLEAPWISSQRRTFALDNRVFRNRNTEVHPIQV